MITEATGVSIGVLVLAVGGLLTLWWRIDGLVRSERTAREAALKEEREAREKADTNDGLARAVLVQSLQAFQLEVAKTYVSAGQLKEVRQEVAAGFERMEGKLEGIGTEIKRLSIEVAARPGRARTDRS